MSHSTPPDCEPNSSSSLPEEPGVLVVRKHHFLVRWSHWLDVPILLGLILSGISIYWASPIYQHKPDPNLILKDSDWRDSDCHNSSSRFICRGIWRVEIGSVSALIA